MVPSGPAKGSLDEHDNGSLHIEHKLGCFLSEKFNQTRI